jgi:hypothetical protein
MSKIRLKLSTSEDRIIHGTTVGLLTILDNLIDEYGIPEFIKIDVEGSSVMCLVTIQVRQNDLS